MYPTKNLQPGQRGQDVAQLQQFLQSQGLLSPQDIASGPGIYGPKTTAAVKAWQQKNGVSNSSGPGFWGPQSISAASGRRGQESQESVDAMYKSAASKNPNINSLTQGGSNFDDIFSALQNGDLSRITDSQGMPFSPKDQQKALEQGAEDNRLYYDALRQKDTADTESALAQNKLVIRITY